MRILFGCLTLAAFISVGSPASAMDPAKMEELQGLLRERSLEVLGEAPSDAPYQDHFDTGTEEAPPPDCKNPRVVPVKGHDNTFDKETNRTFTRWHCDF